MTATGCRYPQARKLTPAEIQKLPEDLRSAAAEARELRVTADPFDTIVAAFQDCGYQLKTAWTCPLALPESGKVPRALESYGGTPPAKPTSPTSEDTTNESNSLFNHPARSAHGTGVGAPDHSRGVLAVDASPEAV
jgi:hypothetical protein